MSPWAFYAPLWLGALLVLALNESVRAILPLMSPATQWATVAAIALAFALHCQVLMFGAQGMFAQVLPVPWGRSIRGRGAVLAGGLLIGWVVLSAVSVLLAYEEATTAAIVIGVLSLAALAAAAITYIWELPTALADFGVGQRHRPPTAE